MLSRMLTRREQAVITSIAIATIAGSGFAYWRMSRAPAPVPAAVVAPPPATAPPKARQPIGPPPTPPDEAAAPNATLADEPEEVAVAIQGAVRQPGMYRFEGDARVQDLIDEAGGVLESAAVEGINLAAELIDGTTLTIPEEVRRGYERRQAVWNPPQYTVLGQLTPVTPQAAPPANRLRGETSISTQSASAPLDLNRATAEDLEGLPGIGPVLAAAIVDYRGSVPFASVDDLINVSGIGPKRLETIRPLVTVE